jgi:hypothetical protein
MTKTAIQINKRLKNKRIYDLGGEKSMLGAKPTRKRSRATPNEFA